MSSLPLEQDLAVARSGASRQAHVRIRGTLCLHGSIVVPRSLRWEPSRWRTKSASLRAEIELTSWPLAKSKRIPFRADEAFCAVMMAAPPPDAVSHSLGFLPRSIDTRSA